MSYQRSQAQNATCCTTLFLGQAVGRENRPAVAGARGGKKGHWKRGGKMFWIKGTILYDEWGGGYVTVFVQIHRTIL